MMCWSFFATLFCPGRAGCDETGTSTARARGPVLGVARGRRAPNCASATVATSVSAIVASQRYTIRLSGSLMQPNDKAPEFTLQDENGQPVSLSDFRGKNVVLYFFPKADTPG